MICEKREWMRVMPKSERTVSPCLSICAPIRINIALNTSTSFLVGKLFLGQITKCAAKDGGREAGGTIVKHY